MNKMDTITTLEEKFESEYEIVSLSELIKAYFDCRRHKRSKNACIAFEMNEQENLVKLWRELNSGTYEIGYSDTFIVTRPKYREVFAADFRDRIVHHLIINRTLKLFEDYFIEDTYNCRVGKGVMYGVDRLYNAIKELSNNYTEDCYILKCDIYSFFMSIDKRLLWKMLKEFIEKQYKGKDLDWVLYIIKMIVMHRPETKCIRKCNLKWWDFIAENKSLFTNGEWLGMAIGNLTSQIFVNFFLSVLDYFVSAHKEVRYGRYVDDFYIVSKDKALLLSLMAQIREFLQRELGITLHPDKWYLQHYSKGVAFTGSVIKRNRKYVGSRVVYNAMRFLKEEYDEALERFVQRYNSYSGFMVHYSTYNIRKNMYMKIPDKVAKQTYIDSGFKALKIRNKYKHKNILLNLLKRNCYGKINIDKRGVRSHKGRRVG